MIDRIGVFLIALSFGALAQSIDLTGKVTNASNTQPLQGVVVTLKNTPALIDTTKADGTYQLSGTVGVNHNLSGVESFSGSRFTSGLLEISVTKKEPVSVETFSLNGVLRARLVHDMMAPGVYKVNIRSSCTNADLCLIKVLQGDKTTVYPFLPMRSSFTNNTMTNKQSVALSKSAAFNDTLLFTMSGFTTARKAIAAATGANNIALTPASSGNTVTDIDGNVYHTVTIGTQVWMVENLKMTHYNDGSAIPLDTNSSTWGTLTTGAYCWYNNDSATYCNPFGALYNWYAVNTGKLAPTGWHVPSESEWEVLGKYLGGDGDTAGAALKATGTTYWRSPNIATNSSGFSALPGGFRYGNGTFVNYGFYGLWWSSTANDSSYAWSRGLYNDVASLTHDNYGGYVGGFSVRCVKDNN